MSSSKVTFVDVYKTSAPKKKLQIKGLKTREREFVISHMFATEEWRNDVINHPEANLRTKLIYPFKVDNSITYEEIVDYFESLNVSGLTIKRDAEETLATI